jgi:hypothetical protein
MRDTVDVHQSRVRLGYDALRRVVLQERGLACEHVRVQEDLRCKTASKVVSPAEPVPTARPTLTPHPWEWERTWFAAGLILADASKTARSSTPKLLTPMLLRETRQPFPSSITSAPERDPPPRKNSPGKTCLLDGFHLGPRRRDVWPRDTRMMDEVQIHVFDAELCVYGVFDFQSARAREHNATIRRRCKDR